MSESADTAQLAPIESPEASTPAVSPRSGTRERTQMRIAVYNRLLAIAGGDTHRVERQLAKKWGVSDRQVRRVGRLARKERLSRIHRDADELIAEAVEVRQVLFEGAYADRDLRVALEAARQKDVLLGLYSERIAIKAQVQHTVTLVGLIAQAQNGGLRRNVLEVEDAEARAIEKG